MLFVTIAGTIIVIATLSGVLAVGGLLHLSRKRPDGWAHLIPSGLIFTVGVQIAMSGRDMSMGLEAAAMSLAGSSMPGFAQWITRLVSISCVALAVERIANAAIGLSAGRKVQFGPPGLLIFFVIFWIGGTLFPTTVAPNGGFSHDMVYPLLFGIAYHLVAANSIERIIKTTRDGLVWLTLSGLGALLVTPHLVLDTNYSQGFIPGLPRFSGLTPHPVVCGMLTQITLFFVACFPYRRRWVNVVAWAALTLTLVLAQSKTAWLSVLVCTSVLALTNYRKQLGKALLNPSRPGAAVGLLATTLLVAVIPVVVVMFSDVGSHARAFFSSTDGAQITSLTGRDIIWDVVFSEWQANPIFGYGSGLLDLNSRLAIGMPNATHAHNQFIDTLGRAGIVGAATLTAYVGALAYWSWRYSNAFNGLPLLLFIMLFLRGVSEVPFTMYGYGAEFVGHLLLIGVLCGAHAQAKGLGSMSHAISKLRS